MSASPNNPTEKPGRLNKAEKRNLSIFLFVLFALGNYFAFDIVQDKFQDTAKNLKKLKADLAYARIWIGDRDLWTKRAEWLGKTQPRLADVGGDPGQGGARLLESLQQAARKDGLAIAAQSLQEPRGAPFYREVSVQLTLTGSLEALCRWLSEVEQPELFQAVNRFSLKCDGTDGSRMRCELTVARWYATQ